MDFIEDIAQKIYDSTFMKKRNREIIVKSIMNEFYPNVSYSFIGSIKIISGANGSIHQNTNSFIVNYRCGYGFNKNNVAPCISICKTQVLSKHNYKYVS
jgi:hypothetical protein